MKTVEILVAGPYQKRVNRNKLGAVTLAVGDKHEFSDDYAAYLVGVKLAKYASGEVVFEQDLDSEESLIDQVKKGNEGRRRGEIKI